MFSILPFWDNVVGGEIPRLFSSLAAAKVEREGGKGAEKPILGREKGGKQILRGGWGRKGEGEIFIRDPTKFFRRNLHHSKKVAETMKKSKVPFRGKEGKNKRDMSCLVSRAHPWLVRQEMEICPLGRPPPSLFFF